MPEPKTAIPFSKARNPRTCVIALRRAQMRKSPVPIVVNATGIASSEATVSWMWRAFPIAKLAEAIANAMTCERRNPTSGSSSKLAFALSAA